jgi:uncharacterized membrane protein
MDIARHRKAIVALVGALFLIASRVFGHDLGLSMYAQDIADLIIMVLTPAAVYAIPNRTP